MEVQPILSASGRAVFSVGGKHAWNTHTHAGFNVSLEWVSNVKHRKNPPRVLCIWRAGNVLHPANENDGIWTIGQRSAVFFVGFNAQTGACNGSVNQQAMPEVIEGLRVMGFDATDKARVTALCDVLVRYLPDLMRMPPAPRSVRNELAPMAMFDVEHINKSSGKTISEGSV